LTFQIYEKGMKIYFRQWLSPQTQGKTLAEVIDSFSGISVACGSE